MSEPFEDSRRLTGANLYFQGAGAALETAPELAFDAEVLQRWRDNIARVRAALDWPLTAICVRRHASGVSLAFAAPMDQLYVGTAVNEWAWCDALGVPITSDLEALEGMTDRAQALEGLRDAARALIASHPGALLEDKGAAIALHWRMTPEAHKDATTAASVAMRASRRI